MTTLTITTTLLLLALSIHPGKHKVDLNSICRHPNEQKNGVNTMYLALKFR